MTGLCLCYTIYEVDDRFWFQFSLIGSAFTDRFDISCYLCQYIWWSLATITIELQTDVYRHSEVDLIYMFCKKKGRVVYSVVSTSYKKRRSKKPPRWAAFLVELGAAIMVGLYRSGRFDDEHAVRITSSCFCVLNAIGRSFFLAAFLILCYCSQPFRLRT